MLIGARGRRSFRAAAVLPLVLTAPLAAVEPPVPPALEFVFEETVTLAAPTTPGPTALGGRNIIPITGGSFEGPAIRGTILPGGWDWQLRRADGCTHIKADYMLRTDDGVVINILNQGVACPGPDGKVQPVRTQAVFEPPLGKYDWLGKSAFVGTLELAVPDTGGPPPAGPPAAVRIRFYRVR